MRALILAAGTGSRLLPLTEDLPKCLVPLAGKPLLQWQIESLKAAGIGEISAVVGYKAEKISPWLNQGLSRLYTNPNFLTTNMVSTLLCAREELTDDLLISYSDIVYSPQVVSALVSDSSEIAVTIDLDWLALWQLRFANPLDDAESLKYDGNGHLIEIGQKTKDLESIMGQYIGLIRFSKSGLEKLQESYRGAQEAIATGKKAWGRVSDLDKAYMTDLLQGLVDEGHKIKVVPIYGNWLEVDSLSDHACYERILKSQNSSHLTLHESQLFQITKLSRALTV